MTRAEALKEARRRWGPTGYADSIQDNDGPGAVALSLVLGSMCEVGHSSRDGSLVVKGRGPSWEVAFQDATNRSGK